MAQRFAFDEVQRALRKHWGLSIHRGGEWSDGNDRHDGRWTIEYSRTGFIVGGQLPGRGHGYIRYDSLTQIVHSCDLMRVIRDQRIRSNRRRRA